MQQKEDPIWKRNGIKVPITVVALAIATIIFFLFFVNQSPGNIGKFEYVGKDETGCLVFCDQLPDVDYYFATNMTYENFIKYISKYAKYTGASEATEYFGNSYRDVSFKNKNGEDFYLTFFDKDASITARRKYNLRNSAGDYIVRVNGSSREKRNDLVIFKEVFDL